MGPVVVIESSDCDFEPREEEGVGSAYGYCCRLRLDGTLHIVL